MWLLFRHNKKLTVLAILIFIVNFIVNKRHFYGDRIKGLTLRRSTPTPEAPGYTSMSGIRSTSCTLTRVPRRRGTGGWGTGAAPRPSKLRHNFSPFIRPHFYFDINHLNPKKMTNFVKYLWHNKTKIWLVPIVYLTFLKDHFNAP